MRVHGYSEEEKLSDLEFLLPRLQVGEGGGALPPDLVNGITGRQDLLSFHVSLVQVVGKGPSSGQIKPRAQTPPDRVDPQLCAPSQSAREP